MDASPLPLLVDTGWLAAHLGDADLRVYDCSVTLVPIVETTAVFPGTPTDKWLGDRVTFQLLGLDLVSLQNLAQTRDGDRSWFGQSTESIDVKAATAAFWRTLRSTDQVFISQGLATSLGKKPGDRLELVVRDRPVTLQIAGLVPKRRDGPSVPDTLLVMDLPALQQSLGKAGRLDRVEWVVEDGPDVVALREDVFAKIAAAGGDRLGLGRRVVNPLCIPYLVDEAT